jgi:hypothetical protein
MEFDITCIDKILLLQTLFAHSAPVNLNETDGAIRKTWGEHVDWLEEKECEQILAEFFAMEIGIVRILNDYKEKPMQLAFCKNKNGRVLADTGNYDARNGKYRFFEAMLNIFSPDEILITKKGYAQNGMLNLPAHLKRSTEQELIFEILIRNTIQHVNEFGKYWLIDKTKTYYVPPFLESAMYNSSAILVNR